ncbi:MAG: amidohydrolase family protein [Parachlamydiaceae bacterium]|nr:amidohydrolase family protein [Parachlamydiaceae bacterium]
MLLKNVIIKDTTHGYCLANISIGEGVIQDVLILQKEGVDYRKSDFYVTPGFVNSHLHPNQLLDRRMLDDLNITELLHGMHTEYKKTDEDRYAQALFVLMDAIKSGATTIYSVASNPYPVIRAFKTCKVKGAVTCFYNDQWEGYGLPPSISILNSIEEQFKEAFKEQTDKVRIHIGSASVESASNDLLILLNDLAIRFKSKVNIHISEGLEAVESCIKSRGISPVRLLAKLGVLSRNWNLVHAVSIDQEEIDLIAQAKASVIHCPVTNAKTGVGVAPIIELLRKNVTIGLGTDACSNNNTNNILNEAYFAILIQMSFQRNAKALSADSVIKWMTQNGHDIIGTKQKGEIVKGEPADLLLWSLKNNSFVPLAYGNFDSSLVYNAPDIKPHTVIIDGEVIVESYQFKHMSEKEIKEAANLCGEKIFKLI